MNECPHCGDRWIGEQDHQCAGTRTEDTEFRMTPKGYLCAAADKEGLTFNAAERMWAALEAGCMKLLEDDSEYAALIFDGGGGTVIGANSHDTGKDSDATHP